MFSGGDKGAETRDHELNDNIWTSEKEEFIKLVNVSQRIWWK